MTTPNEVLLEVSERVAVITLNAPERMNTISGPMLDDVSARLLDADRDRDVRCIILTGAGRAFCAGLDLAAQMSGPKGSLGNLGSLDSNPGEFDIREAPPVVLHNIDTPTICALNGGAAGYGLDLALGADIRVMASSAKLAASYRARTSRTRGGRWLVARSVVEARVSRFDSQPIIATPPAAGVC